MAVIKILHDYCGEEGTDVDKNVFAGSEHTVSRARAAALHAVGLALILHDEAEPAEPVIVADPVILPAAPESAIQDSVVAPAVPAPVADQVIAQQQSETADQDKVEEITSGPTEPLKEEPVAEEKQDKPIANKAAPEPRNKAAPRARNKAPAVETAKVN